MTKEQLAEIRARADAATMGPWQYVPSEGERVHGVPFIQAGVHPLVNGDMTLRHVTSTSASRAIVAKADADMVFIAHARTDIPALLAEVERLTAEVAEWKAAARGNGELREVLEEMRRTIQPFAMRGANRQAFITEFDCEDAAKAFAMVDVALSKAHGARELETTPTLLEGWWNEDPEMRRVEVLCGEHLRFHVRLHQLVVDERGEVEVARAEAGTFGAAVRAAIDAARRKE